MAVLPGVFGCSFDFAQDRLPLRRTVQVHLGTNTLRLPGTRRKRLRCAWHAHLCGLATAIHEISGLNLFFSITAEASLFAEDIFMAAGSSPPVDPKTVAQEVQKGKSLEEVQRIFGIESKSQVQDLYVRGLRQLGEIPQFEMPKAKKRSAAKVVDMGYRRSIGQSGSITLTRSLLLEKLGFQKGDVFQILRQGDDLILRKVD
jgi:hypothetical protein